MSEEQASDATSSQEFSFDPAKLTSKEEVPEELSAAATNSEIEVLNPIDARYELIASSCETPAQLRDAVYRGMYSELQDRVARNPIPTEQEVQIGAYIEALEPQLRDAIIAIRRKGYNTSSSGFDESAAQQLVLETPLSAEVEAALKAQGLLVKTIPLKPEHRTEDNSALIVIRFTPNNAMDIKEMKAMWDKLASMLPDRGYMAPAASHGSAESFRNAVRTGTLQEFVRNWEYKPA